MDIKCNFSTHPPDRKFHEKVPTTKFIRCHITDNRFKRYCYLRTDNLLYNLLFHFIIFYVVIIRKKNRSLCVYVLNNIEIPSVVTIGVQKIKNKKRVTMSLEFHRNRNLCTYTVLLF